MARTETPPPRASPQVSHVASPIPAASAAPVAEVTRIQAGVHRANGARQNGARQIARTIRARRRLNAVPDTADSGQVVRR